MTIDKMHIFRSETSLLFHLNIKSELDKIPVHHNYYYCHSLLITIVKLLKLPYLMSDDLCLFLKLSHPLSHLTNINRNWCNLMHFCDYVSLHTYIFIYIFVFNVDSSNRTIVWWRYFQSSVTPPHLTCLGSLSPGQPGAVLLSTPKLHHQVNHVYGFIVRSLYVKPVWQWELDLKFSMSSYSDEVQTCNQ